MSFLRDFTERPFTTLESGAASAAAGAVDCGAELVVVLSKNGEAARATSKYRPPCPIVVVTDNDCIARQAGAYFAQYPLKVDSLSGEDWSIKSSSAVKYAVSLGLCSGSGNVVVVVGADGESADSSPLVHFL